MGTRATEAGSENPGQPRQSATRWLIVVGCALGVPVACIAAAIWIHESAVRVEPPRRVSLPLEVLRSDMASSSWMLVDERRKTIVFLFRPEARADVELSFQFDPAGSTVIVNNLSSKLSHRLWLPHESNEIIWNDNGAQTFGQLGPQQYEQLVAALRPRTETGSLRQDAKRRFTGMGIILHP
jgi:hypothetical protein